MRFRCISRAIVLDFWKDRSNFPAFDVTYFTKDLSVGPSLGLRIDFFGGCGSHKCRACEQGNNNDYEFHFD
jgi:hypothetical protein